MRLPPVSEGLPQPPASVRDSAAAGGGRRGRPRPALRCPLVEQLAGCGGPGSTRRRAGRCGGRPDRSPFEDLRFALLALTVGIAPAERSRSEQGARGCNPRRLPRRAPRSGQSPGERLDGGGRGVLPGRPRP